jgi:lysophospholipase L1-like esterase
VDLDSFAVVSGALQTAQSGYMVAVGDSVTLGNGPFYTSNQPLNVANRWLQATLKRKMILTNLGVNGTMLYGLTGAAGQIINTMAVANLPVEFMSLQYGINDISTLGASYGASHFLQQYHSLLCFIDDVWDTKSINLAVWTPPYTSIATTYGRFIASDTAGSQRNGTEIYELMVQCMPLLLAAFPNCGLVRAYEISDRRAELLNPNISNDYFHHNDEGSAGLAMALFYTWMTLAQRGPVPNTAGTWSL